MVMLLIVVTLSIVVMGSTNDTLLIVVSCPLMVTLSILVTFVRIGHVVH